MLGNLQNTKELQRVARGNLDDVMNDVSVAKEELKDKLDESVDIVKDKTEQVKMDVVESTPPQINQ